MLDSKANNAVNKILCDTLMEFLFCKNKMV